jgi:hypothetical protein
MLARDRHPLPRSFVAGAPSPSRKLEGDKAIPYPRDLKCKRWKRGTLGSEFWLADE